MSLKNLFSKKHIANTQINISVPFDAYKGTKPFVFISYAHADKEQVYQQIKKLNLNGYRIWYDEGIEPGKNFVDNIAQAIEQCAFFMVFISPNSIASEYVNKEIHFALENKCPFLAIHLSATNLPSGLKFNIGALQAILKHEIEDDRYWKKLFEILPGNLIDTKNIKHPPINEPVKAKPAKTIENNHTNDPLDLDKAEPTIQNENLSLTDLLNEIKLKVDIAGELKGDLNSFSIFNRIKKLDSEEKITQQLEILLINKKRTWKTCWLVATIFKYYKNPEHLKYILSLSKTDFNNKYHNKNVHTACLEYIEAIDSFRNKELVRTAYMQISNTCITFTIRQQAITKLVSSCKSNDNEVVEHLFSRIPHEKIVVLETLVQSIFKFDLTNFKDEVFELMQHHEIKVRLRVFEELIKDNRNLQFNFNELTSIFEYEKHDVTQAKMATFIYRNFKEMAKPYFLHALSTQDRTVTRSIFMAINEIKTTDNFAEVKALELLQEHENDYELSRIINNYLKRLN